MGMQAAMMPMFASSLSGTLLVDRIAGLRSKCGDYHSTKLKH